jgi:TP901 family phage tail tape measure protein
MPLGVREVLLVVRAQNMASGVLRGIAGDFNNLDREARTAAQVAMQQGQSLMALGAGIGALGAAGLAFLGKATSDAVEYNRQVALTRTQMYGVKASFDQVAQAGLDAASKVAVPLDQIQGGLYDIFSSMDVNLKQAKFLLGNFTKEAVAGQVDLSTAERASIGILNSYGMKVKDISKVQDIMFNLVKYGVGTYGDFANSIGRVTGPAVRANQTFQQTAALMAFVTRNGLSASNAASSVGRALDAITKSHAAIQNYGMVVEGALGAKAAASLGITAKSMIKIYDAGGKLEPINVVMTKLGKALAKLNPQQKADVLTEMFKGTGGTIQAMRFFDIAINRYGQLNKITAEMGHSKGALQSAYKIMANTPAAQIQLLENNFHVLMIEVGDVLLPVLNKLVSGFRDVFAWLDKIPRPVLKIIVVVVAITSILLTLAGAVMIVVGAWIIFNTLLAASEIELLPLIGTFALIVAAIAAVAIAAYLIYKHWGPISKWFHDMWFDMWHWIDKIWGDIYRTLSGWWDKVVKVFDRIKSFITTSFDKWWQTHGEALKEVWKNAWDTIAWIFGSDWKIITGMAKIAWAIFSTYFKIVFGLLEMVAKTGWAVIATVFKVAFSILEGLFRVWIQAIVLAAKVGWAVIKFVLKTAWDILVAIFSIFLDIMTGHWHQALVDIEALGHQIWNNIRDFLKTTWNAIKTFGEAFGHIFVQTWDGIWHSIENGAVNVWHNIYNFLHGIWGDIVQGAKDTVSGVKTVWNGIEDAFRVPINWVIQYAYNDGIKALWNTVMNAIGLSKWDLPNVKTLSTGGRLSGFGGGDVVPALLEPGEAVVDKHRTRKYAALFAAMGVPGFAGGGIIQKGIDIGKMLLAAGTGNQIAFVNALTDFGGGSSGAMGHIAAMAATLPVAIMKKVVAHVWHAIVQGAKRGTSYGGGVAGPGGGSAAQNQALAKSLMPAWSFGPLWSDWLMLWNRESGWNQYAMNPTSKAYGIPQSLPWTKMPKAAWPASAGGSSNVRAQETWGISYISGRYGNPANAWEHEISFGWYDHGGPLKPGYTLAYNGTGHDEWVDNGRKGTTVQQFYIKTNEINPRQHAAQLGFELARRSS